MCECDFRKGWVVRDWVGSDVLWHKAKHNEGDGLCATTRWQAGGDWRVQGACQYPAFQLHQLSYFSFQEDSPSNHFSAPRTLKLSLACKLPPDLLPPQLSTPPIALLHLKKPTAYKPAKDMAMATHQRPAASNWCLQSVLSDKRSCWLSGRGVTWT